MFGISWAELFVILLVAVIVIPARMWPDVMRFLAQAVKFVRNIVWRITDASEQIKNQIDLQKPIDELIQTTTNDVLADFSIFLLKPQKKVRNENVKRGRKCKK